MKKVLLGLCILTICLSSCGNNKKEENCDIIVNFTAQANIITK